MKVPVTDEISAMCICGECPSYPGKEKWLYCGRGRSPQRIDQVSCLCPGCPLFEEYRPSDTYYCVIGAAE